MTPLLRAALLLTDLGFLGYWSITALHLLPPEWLYSDAADPVVVAWNWSFLPLDLLASATGLWAVWRARRGDPRWLPTAVVSLACTVGAGLMALSFWAVRCEFDPGWWAVNGLLVAWPLPFLAGILLRKSP